MHTIKKTKNNDLSIEEWSWMEEWEEPSLPELKASCFAKIRTNSNGMMSV